MMTTRSFRVALAPLIGLGVLAASCPAAATPPTIPTFTATVSDLNMVTLRWVTVGGYDNNPFRLVYIHGPRIYPSEGTLFPPVDDVGFQAQSTHGETRSISFRMRPGRYTYVLDVHSNALENATRSVSVDIVAPSPPVVTSANPVAVDPFSPQATTITWSFSPPGDSTPGSVTITRPDGSTDVASGTQYTVAVAASNRFGDVAQSWSLTHCKNNGDGDSICSEASKVILDRRGATFAWVRNTSASGSDAVVSWSGPGNMFLLKAPALTIDTADDTPHEKWVAGTSLAISSPPDGVYLIQSFACKLFADLSATCTAFELRSSSAGTVSYLVAVGDDVRVSTPIATVTDSSGAVVTIPSPIDGRIESLHVAAGSPVARDAVLVTMTPFATTVLQVGESSAWTEADYTTDFNPTTASSSPSIVYPVGTMAMVGVPLDVLVRGTEIWGVGEFQQSFVGITGGALVEHEVPLATALVTTKHGSVLRKTMPFGNDFVAGAASSASAFGERIIEGAPGQIWFTQGGGATGTSFDHARLVRFDTTAVDDPSTLADERFCVYPVPQVDNEVAGVAWAGGRIWFAEGRTHDSPMHSVVGTFDPGTLPCNNLLSYEDASQVNALAYCSQPFAAGCITKIEVPGASFLAQIGVDPTPPSSPPGAVVLWMTEVFGSAIDRMVFTPPSTLAMTRYPAPGASREPGSQLPIPWRIEADDRFAYFSEFGDDDLVRFDKSRASDPACAALDALGKNPCMVELHVPLRTSAVMNSIQLATIRGERRLYFALDNGQIGYARVGTWDGGTLYTGMGALVERQRRDVAGPNFNGLSIGPSSIAISDFARKQFIRLQMK
jgi:biotin carboxyl carrier protein